MLSVGDQLGEMFVVHRGMSRKDARAKAIELMDRVRIPAAKERVGNYPHQFSGGMRQRIMIAMAMALEPSLIIADEPTTALDVTVQAQVMDLLAELQRELNMGLILITHDLGVVADVADKIAVMYAGRIVETAPVHEIYKAPAHPYTKGLLESIPRLDQKGQELYAIKGLPPNLLHIPPGCAFNPRCPLAQDICRGEVPPLFEVAQHRESACYFWKETLDDAEQGSVRTGGEPILEVRDLVKHYPLTQGILFKKQVGAVKAVDGVSFELAAGETLGIVGESGCGKSTVAKMLVHLEQPTAGSIKYKGEDITKLSGRALKAVRRNIQMVFQDPYTSLNPRMTVGDIIGEPYEIHPEVAPKGDRRRKVQDLLDVVGLNPEYINRYPHQFSGGQRQRIGIARGLALNPEIIVADEPVSALDVSVQAQVINLLDRLQAEFNLTYVFIAHDLSIVRHISDRVGVMYLGRFVEIGTDDADLRPPHAPVHPGAAVGGAGARPDGARAPRADHPARRRAVAGQPAVRLPLPHPLLEGPGAVRTGGAAARGPRGLPADGHPGPSRLGVPLRRGEAGGAACRGARRRARRGAGWAGGGARRARRAGGARHRPPHSLTHGQLGCRTSDIRTRQHERRTAVRVP